MTLLNRVSDTKHSWSFKAEKRSNLRNPVAGPQEANTSCATVFQLVQGGLKD